MPLMSRVIWLSCLLFAESRIHQFISQAGKKTKLFLFTVKVVGLMSHDNTAFVCLLNIDAKMRKTFFYSAGNNVTVFVKVVGTGGT
jgi:hypothetical protein|tara:strand:- start:2723 stop:2980 length:258 start_codon:yes stop_codon:yes gene_type:complete